MLLSRDLLPQLGLLVFSTHPAPGPTAVSPKATHWPARDDLPVSQYFQLENELMASIPV